MTRNCMNYLFWVNIIIYFVSATRKEYALRQNPIDRPTLSNRCAAEVTFLPDPGSLCCGRDLYDTDMIKDGTEIELDQFPWSILIKATFKNGNDLSLFSCGGSLISRLYVLTAAHCVFRPGDTLVGIDITLTEYDENCDEIERKPNCADSVLLQVEKVVHHPGFNDEKLLHDIALIKLQEYTIARYITPVCLPKVDIDHLHLVNLPLVVAGWERNGPHVSDIKHSTLVHLVSHAECHRFYPLLSSSHLCAAGRTGEDTRMGDSGGPLMMKFSGSYYVIGVVSGRRENNDTGKTIPSLYTNVFHYIHWIRSNIIRI